jgi:hypothetical protein
VVVEVDGAWAVGLIQLPVPLVAQAAAQVTTTPVAGVLVAQALLAKATRAVAIPLLLI